jgi:deoxyadenosine/deoxycytidine kinase
MYILEGNIGAGKSTFLRLLSEHMPAIGISLEPVHNWQKEVYGQSLLANFYQEPRRWAYTFETMTMICRIQEHLAEQWNTKRIRVVERSIYSGHYCFARNSYERGFMNNLEWQLYRAWFDLLVVGKCMPPHGFIYLHVDPEIAYERIRKRNRYAEKAISLAYLKQIHERHQEFLGEKKDILPELQNIPVLTLDCNEEFETDEKNLTAHLHAVQEFLNSTFIPRDTPFNPSQKTHGLL